MKDRKVVGLQCFSVACLIVALGTLVNAYADSLKNEQRVNQEKLIIEMERGELSVRLACYVIEEQETRFR